MIVWSCRVPNFWPSPCIGCNFPTCYTQVSICMFKCTYMQVATLHLGESHGTTMANIRAVAHGSQVLRPPSMTMMPTWQRFLEVMFGTCVHNWVEQKLDPTILKVLRLKCWDLASVLGLADKSGAWNPTWTRPEIVCSFASSTPNFWFCLLKISHIGIHLSTLKTRKTTRFWSSDEYGLGCSLYHACNKHLSTYQSGFTFKWSFLYVVSDMFDWTDNQEHHLINLF